MVSDETRDYFERLMSDPQFVAEEALDYCAGEMTNCLKRTDALEAENRALREFVAVADEWTKWCVCCMDEYESQFRPVMQQYDAMRQHLATEHGLPLPEVER